MAGFERRKRIFLTGSALALLLTTGVAEAKDRKADKLLAPFTACGAITESAARLACFDAALAALDDAKEVVRLEEEEDIVAGFGFAEDDAKTPDAEAAAQAKATTEVIEEDGEVTIVSAVTEVYTAIGGRVVVLLANGQLWREASNSSFRGAPRVGWQARIQRSGFGGYRMRFEEKTGFLSVTRVR